MQRIDNLIEAELQAAIAAGEQLDWSELKRAAVDATKQSLKEMTALRDAYGAKLDEVQLEMAAAARLRDFATVNDPNANPYAVQYAGERLDDYNMSKFVGSLPVDPVLGTDARQQARTRLEYQQKLGRQHRAAGDRRERLVGRRGHPQPGTRRGSRRCWRRQRKHFRPELPVGSGSGGGTW